MIVVTGGAGFIGSAIIWALNNRGLDDIMAVDSLGCDDRWRNLNGLRFTDYLEKEDFLDRILNNKIIKPVEAIIHMGACSDTTEEDVSYLIKNNYEYTKKLAIWSIENEVRFIYASSAATYGSGANGFSDDERILDKLRPLNAYGFSKHLFDLWAYRKGFLDRIVGLKYFNVFGPNEYHKGIMRSVVLKAYKQIKETGKVKLFKSHRSEYKDGEQKRDFLYITDAVNMTLHFLDNPELAGIFNIGAGVARTWNDLGKAIFEALELEPRIEYIDIPERIREHYQYYTRADISRLRNAGYTAETIRLEDAVKDYVLNFLEKDRYLGE